MLEVTEARYIDGYRIWLRFNNGVEGEADLEDTLWGPVFEPLKDESLFRQFEVSPVMDTICWKNGADLAPEYLLDKVLERTTASSRNSARA